MEILLVLIVLIKNEYQLMRMLFLHYQGNITAASNTYKEALEMAAEKKKMHALAILYVQFSRLIYMVRNI